jgi:hypothetical protein
MSAYSEKVAKAKHGFYRVADFETVREVTHTIAYSTEKKRTSCALKTPVGS